MSDKRGYTAAADEGDLEKLAARVAEREVRRPGGAPVESLTGLAQAAYDAYPDIAPFSDVPVAPESHATERTAFKAGAQWAATNQGRVMDMSAPVAPTREAVNAELWKHIGIGRSTNGDDAWAMTDAVLALLGERREDVQAEALEAWVATVRDELAATDEAATDLGTGYRYGLDSALAQAMERAAELRKAAQS